MVKDSHSFQQATDEPAIGSQPESASFDTERQFQAWQEQLRPGSPSQIDHDPPDFIVECDSRSDCKILFEGVVYLEGYMGGDIRSSAGTLITGPGIINANIDVGTAIIGSFGRINLTATERVLLRGNVIVEGNIRSNSLAIKEGTFFDGNCSFLECLERNSDTPDLPATEPASVIQAVSGAAD